MAEGSVRPQLSPDGYWWWDGLQWCSTLSPDGRHRWDGAQWIPLHAREPASPSITDTMIAPAGFALPAPRRRRVDDWRRWADGRRRLLRVAAIAIGALVLLALAGRAVFGNGPFNPALAASTVRLAWHPGQTETYQVAIDTKATVSTGPGTPTPVEFRLSGLETLRVVAVDPGGAATLAADLSGFSGTSDGRPVPGSSIARSIQFRIAPDGQILAGDASPSAGGLPGGDQFSAILPPGAVHPGDSWTSSFERANPLGSGRLRYTSRNTLLRYEELAGVRTAVVRTDVTVPLDMTVDLGRLAALMGSGSSAGGSGSGTQMRLKGAVTSRNTSWIATGGRDLRKSELTARLDIRMSLRGGAGLPSSLAGGMELKGTETLSMAR
ncbi:MAG: hypothetical protein ACREPA_05725 [Candidatus Dormibacteraceae bacterium]